MQCLVSKCKKRFKESDIKHYGAEKAKLQPVAEPNARSRAKASVKGKDCRAFRPAPGPNQLYTQQWLQKFDADEIDLLPSTKLNAAKEQIQYWLDAEPLDKIIVFSQFKHFQILLGIVLQESKIPFLYFSVGSVANQLLSAADIC